MPTKIKDKTAEFEFWSLDQILFGKVNDRRAKQHSAYPIAQIVIPEPLNIYVMDNGLVFYEVALSKLDDDCAYLFLRVDKAPDGLTMELEVPDFKKARAAFNKGGFRDTHTWTWDRTLKALGRLTTNKKTK